MYSNHHSYNEGFTLVELLLVMSIIFFISTMAIITVDNSRRNARNLKRQADLKQMQTALEVYYDKYGQYPNESWCDSSIGINPTGDCPLIAVPQDDWDYSNASLIGLSMRNNGIMAKLPKDPINNLTYYYNYEPDCNQAPHCPPAQNLGCCWYEIAARMEGGGIFKCDSDGSCR